MPAQPPDRIVADEAGAPRPSPPARFSIAVRYLNGWAMATHPTDRERAEWPPHPDRLFMALVAAAADEAGFDDALKYVERQAAPAISASDAEQREVVTSYVPINDTEITRKKKPESPNTRYASIQTLEEAKEAGLALLPDHRGRQPRTFPVAIPREPTVHFIYEADGGFTTEMREKLAALCARVTRVGHSASLVQCWLDFDPPPANLVPSTGAAPQRLRIPSTGRLEYLRGLYELNHQQGTDLRPTPGVWAGYAPARPTPVGAEIARSVFDPAFLVLRPVEDEGRRPPLVSTLRLTEALRGLLMNGTPRADIPEALSGHTPDGKRLDRPHLAIVPLPFVGHEHADGRVMGMALILPRDDADAAAIGRALNRKLYTSEGLEPERLDLKMGGAGTWTLDASDAAGAASLRPESWSMTPRGAEAWATVTPIVLDRHPKSRQPLRAAEEMQAVIADACVNIGLPRPIKVEVGPVSVFAGVPHARDFPALRRKDGSAANYTHAVFEFDRPLIGPVLLGAGRYRGYGLCRPLIDRAATGSERVPSDGGTA
ncbi:MAG: type I-U CRISPR-associated protein Cas5/Cas6 [Phycisphaerae bacterium]|nr:MAG: type I-U CRISPR-associated protein Cas5/Cas6 [Phycisphaerae bacterium]MBE7458285.1 type I-U CRISPR-associated protein Cas5/Cas6 [Planctomycetia bacterium]MCL4720260.1 type I-U CRISPR-associated protein Cas5/Cas6 [Phycisphaerae bacterium]